MYPMGYKMPRVTRMITVNEYKDGRGRSPYSVWLGRLKDSKAKARIILNVDKMELGMFADAKPVGGGVSELRIHFGPGYRVYFAKSGNEIYLLLCGGDKSSQIKDINRAKRYWVDYKMRFSDDK